MYHKYNKNKPELRTALWIVYDKKDAYTDSPIEYRELEVDHIIPQACFENQKTLYELLDALKLPHDFEKDSLENYLPTRRGVNSRKGDDISDTTVLLASLKRARENIEKIEAEIEKYKKAGDVVTEATRTAVHCISQSDKELACDIIFNESSEFTTSVGCEYVYIRKRVSLRAKIPNIRESSVYCSIEFKSLKKRDCTIFVDEKEILTKLFISNGYFDDLNKRPFITAYADEYMITIGNCQFNLSLTETKELCEAIDEFYFDCIDAYKEIDKLNSGILRNRKREALLCTLSYSDYEDLWAYIDEKGLKMLEVASGSLKICKACSTTPYNAIIYVYFDDNYLLANKEPNVRLCLAPNDLDPNNVVSNEGWWSPSTVRDWLINELFNDYQNSRRKISYSFPDNSYKLISDYSSTESIFATIKDLQCLFSSTKGHIIFTSPEQDKLLSLLLLLIRNSTKYGGYSYMGINLGYNISSEAEAQKVITDLQDQRTNIRSYQSAEVILRCCIDILKNGNLRLSGSVLDSLKGYLNKYVDEYNVCILRKKNLLSLK